MKALAYLDSLQGSGIRPGLRRIRVVLRHLGRPELAYPSILVAGTNGKGSTSSMLASILNASGYRTALYTSPHLVDIRERWMIGGAMIDDALLDQSVAELRAAADAAGIVPTYFEAMTLIAFIAFRTAKCEVAVLEVGMGGRLDATNVVRPIAAVITPVGFDHMEYLGTTLPQIAKEKAGIVHRGAIALTSNDDAQVIASIQRRATNVGAPLQIVNDEHDTPLTGPFQRRNAALAVRTAEALMNRLPRITPESIARGVKETRWRGRLECIRRGRQQIWIDGCHNGHAIAVIAPFIEQTLPRPRTLVFGIMADKDFVAVARTLFPLFDRVIATEPFPPRSVVAQELMRMAFEMGIAAEWKARPDDAFARATKVPEDTVFIGGSLYLAGAAIAYFDSHPE